MHGRPACSFMRLMFAVSALLWSTDSVVAQDAEFSIRSEVLAPDIQAFTATIGAIGNGADFLRRGGGFEPIVFRTMLTAQADSQDSIVASSSVITNYDSWPEGLMDGAEVEVLRIENGSFKTVRLDRVARGGHKASGWLNVLPDQRMLPAEITSFESSWDGFNRRDVPWHYTVRAVDGEGSLSLPAATVSVTPPGKPGKAEQIHLEKVELRRNDTAAIGAPGGLVGRVTAKQTLLLTWDPVPGAVGYIVYRSDLPPDTHKGYSIDLEGEGSPIRKGDMAMIRKKFFEVTRAQVATNRIWSAHVVNSTFSFPLMPGMSGENGGPVWRVVPHAADSVVEDPGETYLQIDLQQGQDIEVGLYNHSGTGQDFYPVLDPAHTYRFDVWMRTADSVSAAFSMPGIINSVPRGPAEFQPGPDWKKYSFDFRPSSLSRGVQVGKMLLTLSGSGRIEIDNFRVYRSDAPYMEILPEDIAALKDSGMSALRTHAFVRTGFSGYDLSQLSNAGGGSTVMGGNTLPQTLHAIASVGMDPWLQIEPHFTREEWLGFVEYLAAPFDPATDDAAALPWAAKRVAQGRNKPWTDEFDRIYFEIGNETWNRLFAPWTFSGMPDGAAWSWRNYSAGEVYGLYQEHVLAILRESPWWSRLAPHLEPVLGGWAGQDYGVEAARMSPNSTVLGHAAYIGGWDSGEGPVRQTREGYASVTAFAPQVMDTGARRYHDALAGRQGRPLTIGTYESGPGYAKNGLNNERVTPEQMAEQERVMKSGAAGAATLDSFLTRASVGDRIQNYFNFGRGVEWTSHAEWFRGGQAYPAWEWLALFNREGLGDMLVVDTVTVPRRDLEKMGWRRALQDVPMVAVFATRQADRLTVTVISREVPGVPMGSDGHASVRVKLPIQKAAGLTRYRMTGSYKAENTAEEQTRLISERQPVESIGDVLEISDLWPASAEIYVYDGVKFETTTNDN